MPGFPRVSPYGARRWQPLKQKLVCTRLKINKACNQKVLHEQARSLVRPSERINLNARFEGLSSESTCDFETRLLKSLKSTKNARPRNITHLAVLYALHTSKVLSRATSIGLCFYLSVSKSVSYVFTKEPEKPRKVHRCCEFEHEPKKESSSAGYIVKSNVRLPWLSTSLKHTGREDLTGVLDQYLDAFSGENLAANPGQQISDWFKPIFRQTSSWKYGKIDVSDQLIAPRLAKSLRNHLHIAEPAVNHVGTIKVDVRTRGNSVANAMKRIAWVGAGLGVKYFHWDGGMEHRAFIALGSNLGDRLSYIEKAATEMERLGLRICRFGHLYETSPMYLTEQPSFLNTVCEVETNLKPLQLLDLLQSVERALGRVRLVENGPRTIDLDILLYDNDSISDERLTVPHKLMVEREFVLRPLCDLETHITLPPPFDVSTVGRFLEQLETSRPFQHRIPVITMLSPRLPLHYPKDNTRRTYVMAVINLTPDSFSDGGLHAVSDVDQLRETFLQAIRDGADIIDIGGQSTRPGASPISTEEELKRILPAIKLIRCMPEAKHITISVDTFLAPVAEQAVKAGADFVNDISAGRLDEEMLATVAKLQTPIVLMHSRGTPDTMKDMTHYPHGLIKEVADELAERVRLAELAGIRRWRIILDPGIGFAKDQDQNLELLRRLPELKSDPRLVGFPWLVGASRKGFIGRITGAQQANERVWGTAAAVTASIQGGADIVRVHDVAEMSQVVKMADAMFRVEKGHDENTTQYKEADPDSLRGGDPEDD